MALCAQCARCEYVSISPRWNDCSWYHSCDLNRTLTNVQNILSGSYHTDKSSQRGTWHEQLGAVTSEGAARELITEREEHALAHDGRCRDLDHPFVFLLSVGRSGGTSLMWVLNSLPSSHIAGENEGLGNLIVDIDMATQATKRKAHLYTSWVNTLGGYLGSIRLREVRCSLARLMASFIGAPGGASLVGFKTIRIFDKAEHLAELFPCSRFIINGRRKWRTRQRNFHNRSIDVTLPLETRTDELMRFAHRHRDRAFVINAEQLTLGRLNAMLHWLAPLELAADNGTARRKSNEACDSPHCCPIAPQRHLHGMPDAASPARGRRVDHKRARDVSAQRLEARGHRALHAQVRATLSAAQLSARIAARINCSTTVHWYNGAMVHLVCISSRGCSKRRKAGE